MKSDLPEYFSIFAHGDVIFELAAPPPGRREARCASSSNVRSAHNHHALQT
jgi:hypothetical protein